VLELCVMAVGLLGTGALAGGLSEGWDENRDETFFVFEDPLPMED